MTDGDQTRRRVLTGLAAAGAGGLALTTGAVGSTDTNTTDPDAADAARATPESARDGWPMFGNNALKTGRTLSEGPEDGVAIRWEFDLDATTPPAVIDDTIYVGTGETLTAVDLLAEEAALEVSLDSSITTCPAVGDDSVFVGTEDGAVYAIDRQNGDERWTYDTDGAVTADPTYVASEGEVYLASDGGTAYKLAASGGHERWATDIGDGASGSVTVSLDTQSAYVPQQSGDVIALDYETGFTNRFTFDGGASAMTPASIDSRRAYTADANGTLYEFNARQGEQHWQTGVTGSVTSAVASREEEVFVATDEGHVYSFRSDFGDDGEVEQRWHTELDAGIVAAPVLAQGRHTLYLGGEAGAVYALDVRTGEQRWSAELGAGAVDLALYDGFVWAVGDALVALGPGSETELTASTSTPTPTQTPTETATPTATQTATETPTATPTETTTATAGPAETATPTDSPTPTESLSPQTDRPPATTTAGSTPTPTVAVDDTPAGDDRETTSADGPLPLWLTLAGVGSLAALGLRDGGEGGADSDASDESA